RPSTRSRGAGPRRWCICTIPMATRRLRLRTVMNRGLEPAPPLEPDEGNEGAGQDQGQPERVAPSPVEFGHELEVHAIEAGYQRRWDPHYRGDGEHLEQVVLLDCD